MTLKTLRSPLVLASLLATAGLPSALANGGSSSNTACTQQTTRGQWMYTCEGILPFPAPATPTRMLGTCSTSRSAYWSCTGTVNVGGSILSQVLQGQANNQPDCTGTIAYTHTLGGAPAGTLEINYVVYNGGRAISGLPTNSGGVLACSLRRIAGND